MANISKSNVFPTISKVHIKDTFILYNNLVKNAMKYQSAMVALAAAVNDLSHSYDDFLSYAPMRAIIESSGQQNDIHNSLKIYRILYESFKKMGEFLNRDFALPLNDDFKSMQVKFNDKKIEKTLKMEEKQRTKSLIPGILPEPSNIQRGLFQQYISAIKFVTRKTRKLQNYESHVFERMVQGIAAYEEKNSNIYNSFSINQSMTRDNYEEPTPRLNYLSGVNNKKSIFDVSQLDNATFEENILNHDNNPLTNSFIKDEIKKNELNGDKYFHSNISPIHNDYSDKVLRESVYGNDKLDKEMESNVNTNKGGSSDYSSKRDYHHHRYTTSTPNIYEMKYVANKYEDKNGNNPPSVKDNYRNRSKSFGAQNISEKYKQSHYSMPATKNPRFSVPANINEKKESENTASVRFSTIKGHSSSSSSGKSNHSAHNEATTSQNEVHDKEPETNEEADTTITEVTVKKESKSKLNKKSSIKNDLKKNFSDMKNILHKRRSTNNSPSTKPVSILKNKNSSKDSKVSNDNRTSTISKGDDLSKLQDIINQEDGSNDEEEFIVISKKKMDTLIRDGKVHSIDDILKNKHSSVSSNKSDAKIDGQKDIVESPTEMKNDTKMDEKNNVPNGFVNETPNLANEETPVLKPSQPPKSMENVPMPTSKHNRSSSYGGAAQSHIRGMSSNLASKHFPSIVPNGYATPMLGHQEPTVHQHKFNKAIPMDYATPMLSHYNNNAYSPMLQNDVPSVKDDISPPSRRAKSTYSIQNLLNNWPNIEELTKARENHPIFNNRRKNSLPIYDRKTPLATTPITADSPISKPTLTISTADDNIPKKKGVNWDDNNKEYVIPKNEKSTTEESYYDDIINNTYATENEESSMMINDPTRLIFSRFNTSTSNVSAMTEESTLQTPTIQTPTPMDSLMVPNKKDTNKRLNGLRNIITRDVLEDELPPTPVTPTVADNTRLNGATSFEPDMPIRGESLNFLAKRLEAEKKVEKNVEEVKKDINDEVEEIKVDDIEVEEEELLTPIEKVEVSVIDENEIIDDVNDENEDDMNENEIEDDEEDSDDDSEDNIKLAEIPRFNKAILKLKVKRSAHFDGELASPCPTPTTYMINKIKEIEDKNKEKSEDELDYNSEEDLDILRFISYRRAPEVLEKHLKENEQEEENNSHKDNNSNKDSDNNKGGEYTTTNSTNPKDPFNYSEETTEDQTEEVELSDIENEIIEANLEIEMPKKNMDRKDSVKSVISNISSKFSQKLNSMFSNSESSTAVNSSETESTSEAKENKPTVKEVDNEVSVITEEDTTIDEQAIKENIEEQKARSKDVLNFARKFSSDFIKGGSDLIRRSSKDSIKSISRKFSTQSDKPEEMEAMMQKSNSIKSELQRRNSSASLTTRKENTSIISDDRSIKTTNTITSASLPRKDSLIRAASVKKNTSVRSVGTVGTNGSNLTSTPIMNPAMEDDDDFDETPRVANFPERPERPIPQRPATPNAPNTPVFPNIKLCNILMNHEEPSSLNLNDQDGNDIIVISNPLLEVTNNKNLAEFKDDLPDERHEFRISRNEAYMTFDLCQNAVDIESAMGSIIDPDDDSRMELLGESSLSFRSINPNSVVYEEKDSIILAAPKLNKKKPDLEIDTKLVNTSKVVAIIPSPVPQKDNNFAQRFNNLNAASLLQETREQQQQQQQQSENKNKSTVAMKKYVALYPYNARDGRELSFQRADIINVRREQGEWVYGFKENLIENEEIKYGWVPKSYLKIISIF